MSGKRRWSPLSSPPAWQCVGARVLWHFVLSYHEGKPGTITSEPYQTGAGDWLVRVKLDEDGRTIPAAIESLDPLETPAEGSLAP